MAHIAPESPVLGEALERRAMLLRARNSHTRLLVSLLLALSSLYEANHSVLLKAFVPTPPLLVAWVLYTTEMLLFAVATANLLGSVWTVLAPLHGQPPLALTDRQFSLLKLHPSSPLFTKSPEKKTDSYPNPFTPLPGPLLSPASASSPAISPPNSPQTPANMSSTSWLSTPSTPGNTSTNLRRDHFPASPDLSLTDETSLASYLSNYRAWESTLPSPVQEDATSQGVGSAMLWRPHSTIAHSGQLDFSSPGGAAKQVYQLSVPSPPTPSSPGGGEKESASDKTKASVLSQRLGIDPLDLVGWNENLRVWLTQTVLRPLVKEIDSANAALPKQGVADCQIGQVAVERLRKVAALPQVAQSVPHLTALLPYLEVSPDQSYLISRIRMLAKTGALSLFRWNGGGDGWTERLPSDAELLVHCLACYFDARLLTSASMRLSGTTNPQAEVMKPFTGVHFYRHGEKPGEGKENTLAIVQLGRSPAHYVVQVGAGQLDVGTGRNNLIHTILLFLYRVRQDRAGMLGRVNLGLSGLNLLWVLD